VDCLIDRSIPFVNSVGDVSMRLSSIRQPQTPDGHHANSKLEHAGSGPHLALITVQIIFGTWPIFGKIVLRVLPSTGLVALRVAGATLAFLFLLRLRGRLLVPRRADLARLALYSLLGVVLNQFLFVKGLALSTVVNATLISTSIPIFALLVSALIGYERLTKRAVFGTIIAAAGVVFLVDPLRANLSGDTTLGNLLLIISNIMYGTYIAISRDVFRRYGALTAMTWVFAFGSLAAVPFGGYYLAQVNFQSVGLVVLLSVIYIVLVPTVGAYYLNAWALERVTPSTVAVYIYLQPLIAFALAPLFLGAEERWGVRQGVAALLIFTGVAVVTLRRHARAALELTEQAAVVDATEQTDALGH
jgi:drug/metabolite transporter (DMT)-like permease